MLAEISFNAAEAIEELKYAKQYFHVDGESFDLAIKALEKQIPKKAIRERAVSQEWPVCGRYYL